MPDGIEHGLAAVGKLALIVSEEPAILSATTRWVINRPEGRSAARVRGRLSPLSSSPQGHPDHCDRCRVTITAANLLSRLCSIGAGVLDPGRVVRIEPGVDWL
jgi:hypothetical protein